MATDRREVRLTFVATGESVVVELLDDEAPITCAHVWNRLPIEAGMIHGQFSGAEVFVLLDDPVALPGENLVQLPLPGELLFFYEAPLNATSFGSGPAAEIAFIYGRGVSLKEAEGVPTHLNLFGRVRGDWKYDWTAFAAACRRVRTANSPVLRIERVQR